MMLLYGETRHSDACKVRYKTGDDRDLFVVIVVLFMVVYIVSYILSHTPQFSKNLSAKYSLIHIVTYIFLM